MRLNVFFSLILSHLLAGAIAAEQVDFASQVKPVLAASCFKCHGEKKQKGELRIDTLSPDLLADRRSAERWHDIRDAVRLGDMPPEDEPPLGDRERQALLAWIDQEIDALAAARKNTDGRVVLRRLNRAEYQNTMRDLIGIETDYAGNLPPDGRSEGGFQNDGSTLQMSDLQLDYYLQAARAALARAIVTGPEPEVFSHTITKTVQDKGRGSHLLDDDQQFVAKLKDYPPEGEFIIRAKARAKLVPDRGYPQLRAAVGYRADVRAPRAFLDPVDVTSEEWQTFELRERIEHFPLPSKTQSKFPGLLIWLDNAYAEGRDKPLKPKRKKKPKKPKKGEAAPEPEPHPPLTYPLIEIESMEFVGPVFDQWPPRHHTQILFPSDERETDEPAYAVAVIERFASRAFRRPVGGKELSPYADFFREARAGGLSFEEAIRETLAMVLISPEFLYLVEPAGDTKRRVDDWELASRLSYFLWSTMPDARLLAAAEAGQLGDPKTLQAEVERLLADGRSWRFVEQFCGQWLDVDAVDRVAVNPEYYPDFDNQLKVSMRGETLHFFREVMRNDLSALSFLDADFTMLDEPLAKHYGLAGPRGSAFERVALRPGDRRGGVLAQGSMLLGNSTGDDSHPVKRAVWIRERLLDDPPSEPPPNVPSLDTTDPDFARLPVREQLRVHREEASCNDCHRSIDPWGIALENFGGDGLWRDQIKRRKSKGKGFDLQPVEAATTLPDGSEIGSLQDLKAYLAANRNGQFAEAFTTKLLTYALGRGLELADEPQVEELTQKFIHSGYRIPALIHSIVASEAFQSK